MKNVFNDQNVYSLHHLGETNWDTNQRTISKVVRYLFFILSSFSRYSSYEKTLRIERLRNFSRLIHAGLYYL